MMLHTKYKNFVAFFVLARISKMLSLYILFVEQIFGNLRVPKLMRNLTFPVKRIVIYQSKAFYLYIITPLELLFKTEVVTLNCASKKGTPI